jgi:D-inositol-3-phosphate glycosyltransferase
MKILWIGDGGISTGFARVNHSIIENLPDDWEIHHIAVNYRGDPYKTTPNHFLYPAQNGGDVLGIGRINPLIEALKPDMMFILGDPWVIYEYMKVIKPGIKVVTYVPVDAQHLDPAWVHNISKLDQTITYTEFGKNEFLRQKNDFEDIRVIPHGTDISKFYPLDKLACRKKLGIDPELFIVFNGNRNQPRKRVDLTIKAFAKFAEGKDDVRLYLHMGVEDAGFNVKKLCEREGIIGEGVTPKLIMTSEKLSPSASVSIEHLNIIYNAMDVGINTSMGEGWGLVNVEQACCKVPQIVPNYSATAEIFSPEEALHINIERTAPHQGILTEGGIIDVDHAAELLERLYQDRKLGKTLAENAYQKFARTEYTWKAIGKQWEEVFLEMKEKEVKNKPPEPKQEN